LIDLHDTHSTGQVLSNGKQLPTTQTCILSKLVINASFTKSLNHSEQYFLIRVLRKDFCYSRVCKEELRTNDNDDGGGSGAAVLHYFYRYFSVCLYSMYGSRK